MKDVKSLSFEEALAELENAAQKLEESNINLDESVKLFEYGNKLRDHCEQILNQAKLKVEKIVHTDSGKVCKENFEADS